MKLPACVGPRLPTCEGGRNVLLEADPLILFWIAFTLTFPRATGLGVPSTAHALFPASLSSPT